MNVAKNVATNPNDVDGRRKLSESSQKVIQLARSLDPTARSFGIVGPGTG